MSTIVGGVFPTGAVFGPTPGVSRNMQEPPEVADLAAMNQGGGDLNGSANTANLLGHAGTAAQRIAVPRTNLGNYTGII
jgi:hypothetical protein